MFEVLLAKCALFKSQLINNIWKQIIDSVASGIFTFIIDAIARFIKKQVACRKKERANNDLINYFHNTITPEKGSLNHILYNNERLILAKKYHISIQAFLSYNELEQHLLNDAEKVLFIDSNKRQKIKERILNIKNAKRGSATIETVRCIFLITFGVSIFCKVINQILTNTFVVTFGKIAGFLLAVSILIYHHWHLVRSRKFY